MGTQSRYSRRGVTAAADGASKPRRHFLGAWVASASDPQIAVATPPRARIPTKRLHLHDRRVTGSRHYACDARFYDAAAASLLNRAHLLDAEIIGIDDPNEEREPVRLRVWRDDSEQLG